MPLLVAPRSSHGVALVDHQPLYRLQPPRSGSVELEHQSSPPPPPPEGNGVAAPPARAADSAVDFSMSKFKASSRHSLYRQFYGGDESPPYEKPTEETEPAEPEGREKSFGKVWLNNEAQWHHPIAMAPGQPPTPIVPGPPLSSGPPPPPLNMSLPPGSSMALHSVTHQPSLYLNPTSLMSLRDMMLQSPAGLSLLNADAGGPLGLLKRSMLESMPSSSSPSSFPLGSISSSPSTTATSTYSLPSIIPTTVASLSQQQQQQQHNLNHHHHHHQIKKERDESDIEMDGDREELDETLAKHRRAQSPTLPAGLHRPQLSLSPFRSSPPSSYYRTQQQQQPSSAIDQAGLPHRSAAATVSHQPHLYHHAASSSATSATVAVAAVAAAIPSHQRHPHQRDSAERELHLNASMMRAAKNDRDSQPPPPPNHGDHPSQLPPHLLPPPGFANRAAELELLRDGGLGRPGQPDSDGEREEGNRRKQERAAGGHAGSKRAKAGSGDEFELHRELRFGAMASKVVEHDATNHVQSRRKDPATRSKSSSPGK